MDRSSYCVAVVWAALIAQTALCQPSFGQSLLGQAERLQPPPGGAVPATNPAPSRGAYLGYTPVDGADDSRGVTVESVKPGAPAALGGLEKGDLITAVNGKQLTLAQFDDLLREASPGQKLQLTVDRRGQSQQLTITLGAKAPSAAVTDEASPEASFSRPTTPPAALAPPTGAFSAPGPASTLPDVTTAPSLAAPSGGDAVAPSLSSPTIGDSQPGALGRTTPPPLDSPGRSIQAQPLELGAPPTVPSTEPGGTGEAAPSRAPSAAGGPSLGITVYPLTEETRLRLGVPVRRGAQITDVKPGSPAAQAGLPVGAVIVRLDSREVASADDLVAAIKSAHSGQEVEVTYYERTRLLRKIVRLAPAGGTSDPNAGDASGGAFASSPPESGRAGEGLLRGGAGNLGNRPMLRNLGQMASEALSRPAPLSTVYDPSVVAALQDRVAELTEQTRQLEERIRALEGRQGAGNAAPTTASSPAFAPPANLPPASPSFSAPTGPSFGPAIGTPGVTGVPGTTP